MVYADSRIFSRGFRCVLAVVAALAAGVGCAEAVAEPPQDAAAIQSGIAAVVAGVKASSAAKRMDYGELTVELFFKAHGRPPSPSEFFLIRETAKTFSSTPEEVLSLVLREDEPGPTWEQCRRFLERVHAKSAAVPVDTATLAQQLADTPPDQVLGEWDAQAGAKSGDASTVPEAPRSEPAAWVDYPAYFGYFHDHSELSLDAEGDPYQAYRTARDLANLDFYSLADHAEYLILWPWDNKWDILRDAANAAYQPHQFAALWGFEWSNPLLRPHHRGEQRGVCECRGDLFAAPVSPVAFEADGGVCPLQPSGRL